MLWKRFLTIVLFVNLTHGQVYDIKIEPGVPYRDIKNPGYSSTKPLPTGTSIQWNLEVKSESTIKVFCDDIRMSQPEPFTPECKSVYLSFDEGDGEQKVCGQDKGRTPYRSKGSRLTVKMVSTEGSGYIQCTAINAKIPEPKVIELTKNKAVALETPKTPIPYWDHVWILKSPPNTRISVQCEGTFFRFNPCYKDVLTIDNGSELKEFCGGNKITEFTKSNSGKVRMQLNENGDTRARCVAQAVTGPNANEYLNFNSEEVDSAEFGLSRWNRKTNCNCGRRYVSPARIINGNETLENEFTWMVLLNIYGSGTLSYCGASIITKRHVLTAAHCVVSGGVVADPDKIIIKLAEHDRAADSRNVISRKTKEVFVHENYLKDGTHDIAVLFTDNNILFSKQVGPICLTRETLPLANRHIKIMGWGQTEHGGGSDVLLKSKVKVISHPVCGKDFPDYEICTYGKPGATCYGDSGGPLVWYDEEIERYTQVALVSRATNHICDAGYGIDTHVPSFIDWIEDVIQKTEPWAKTCQKIV